MQRDDRIYVAGHAGLVGSALVRRLRADGHGNLILRSRAELDLCDGRAVADFFAAERPAYVFCAAAAVGGIQANLDRPAELLRDNLLIAAHVVDAAHRHGAHKLLYLGSSCIYPRLAPQPIKEADLLTGPLEPTNQAYAIAKIAGLELCAAYRRQHGLRAIALMPTNLYGPGDDFDPERAHVVPALLRKLHEAKLADAPSVTVWGTGTPRRELLHVDDLADACVLLMQRYDDGAPINVGSGADLSILSLAHLIAEVVGYAGELLTNPSRPDGTPRKLLDGSRLRALGWRPRIPLREGLAATYRWYLDHLAAGARGAG